MSKYLAIPFLLMLTFISCTERAGNAVWSVPDSEIFDGGPGKDGIPSVDNAEFITLSEVNYLDDSDMVIVVEHEGAYKIYPHIIMDWHEIVNDRIDDYQYALTYCPLTGTAINWNRVIDGEETTFGVSGKLYNSNLIPYDRKTDSNWSQMRLDCINGSLRERKVDYAAVLETEWSTAKTMFPAAQVMTLKTGFSRSYGNYPYGDYITNHNNLIFPTSISDDRLPSKTRCHVIHTESGSKAYNLASFETASVIEDKIGGKDVLVIGSESLNFIVAFEDDLVEDLEIDLTNLPIIAVDKNGNKLDISGNIVEGPMEGEKLIQPDGFMGYWFALGAFYEDLPIYE